MKLTDIGMLIVSSPRSNAYLQALIRKKLYPSHIIFMEKEHNRLSPGQISPKIISDLKKESDISSFFDVDVSITDLINEHNISYEICPSQDINGSEILNIVQNRPEKYFIYSGIGGVRRRKSKGNDR